jgi:hypothetical protein
MAGGLVEEDRQLHTLRLGGEADRLGGGGDHQGQVDGAHLQSQAAGDDPRSVEDVLDELRLGVGVALNHLRPRVAALPYRYFFSVAPTDRTGSGRWARPLPGAAFAEM